MEVVFGKNVVIGDKDKGFILLLITVILPIFLVILIATSATCLLSLFANPDENEDEKLKLKL